MAALSEEINHFKLIHFTVGNATCEVIHQVSRRLADEHCMM